MHKGMSATLSAGSVGMSHRPDENYGSSGDAWDPEALIECPFDKSHQIRSKRFPYHYVKCLKNHPELARVMKTCPYNARHVVHNTKLASHMSVCDSRPTEEKDLSHNPPKWKAPFDTMANPDQTEDWEKEVDNDAPPFVLGMNTSGTKKPEVESKTGQSFRMPNTDPWV